MKLFIYVLCFFASMHHCASETHHDSKVKEKLMVEYNLTGSTKGAEAVDEALNFLLDQRAEEKTLIENEGLDYNSSSVSIMSGKSGSSPICQVTVQSAVHRGMFEYLADDGRPLYDGNKCWARRIRYHTAPHCANLEKVVPIYKWKWHLKDAFVDKRCSMPSTRLIEAASSYLKLQKQSHEGLRPTNSNDKSLYKTDRPGEVVNLLMLGLSMMGQPFQSLICMNNDDLSVKDSYVRGVLSGNGGLVNGVPLSEVRKNDGHCTGYAKDHIKDFFPQNLHPSDYEIPHQSISECALDNGLMVFKPKAELADQLPTVRVCYTYTFNLSKNIKVGSKLPCGWLWTDVDVVLALHSIRELVPYYLQRTGAVMNNLNHLKVVDIGPLYQGLLMSQLNTAYSSRGMNPLKLHHIQAKPKDCDHPDMHYRLPGITDHAIVLWTSLISTGLHGTVSASCKINHQDLLKQKKEQQCQVSTIGAVKFFA